MSRGKWKKRILLTLVPLLLVISLVTIGCPAPAAEQPVVEQPAPEVITITILHTGDLHGHLDPFLPRRAEEYIGGIARIATLVEQIRAEKPNTILLDAGDTMHGTNLANLFEGESVIAAMNLMGFSAMTAGNHDFNFRLDVLEERVEQANFPILAANVRYKTGEAVPFLRPYVVVEAGGLEIAIIGLVPKGTPITTHPANVEDLKFLDMAEVARELVEQLKPQVDLIFVVAHLGSKAEEDALLKVPGIAVLVSELTGERVMQIGDTILVNAGTLGKSLGRLDITVKDGAVIGFSHAFLPIIPAIEADAAVDAILDPFRAAIEGMLAEVVGEAAVVLDGERAVIRTRETNLGNLVADILRALTGADIAIQNSGGIRTSIDVGPITLEEIFTVLPFDNSVVALELTGEEILAALENSVSYYPELHGRFPQVSGMSFLFDPAQPSGERIIEVTIGNEPLVLDRTYIVATNCFMAAGGDEFTMLIDTMILDTGDFLRDAVAAYIAAHSPVAPQVEGRIRQVEPAVHLTIIHTNDLHARVNPFTRPGETGTVGGLARIATVVENVRAEGRPTLVLDGGDTFHGTGIGHYTQGQVMVKAMNAIGYDAMVVANHEFNWGADPLFAAKEMAMFPFLSANLVRAEDGTHPFAPYIIFERDGVSIGVLGLSERPNRHRHQDAPDARELIRHLDPVEVAQEFVPLLRQQVDVLIVLSHLGHPTDRKLAQSVDGIDIILSASFHWLLTEPVVVGRTLIVENGWRGEFITRLDLTVQEGGEISVQHQLIHIDDAVSSDPEVQAIIDAAYADFPELKRVVGYSTADIWTPEFKPFDPDIMPFLEEPEPGSLWAEIHEDIRRGAITFRDSRAPNTLQETVLGNVIADAIRYVAGTDVAVQRAGCIRAGVSAGEITVDDLFTPLPFDMSVVVYHLSGDLLRQLLEVSVGPWPRINSNFLQVSGLKFTIDPTRDAGQRVTNIFIAGAPLDPTRIYSVGVTHSPIGRVWGRVLREIFLQGEFVHDTGVFVRDALVNYLGTHSPISPGVEGRIGIDEG